MFEWKMGEFAYIHLVVIITESYQFNIYWALQHKSPLIVSTRLLFMMLFLDANGGLSTLVKQGIFCFSK